MLQRIKTYSNNAEGCICLPIDDMGWERSFYIEYNGSLVACRFIKWMPDFHSSRNEMEFEILLANGEKSHCYALINCGELTCFRAKDLHNGTFEILDRKANPNPIKMDIVSPDDWLCDVIDLDFDPIGDEDNTYYVRWYWDGIRPQKAYIYGGNLTYTYDGGLVIDGYALKSEYGESVDGKTYATNGECSKDNRINVIDFPEDKKLVVVVVKV